MRRIAALATLCSTLAIMACDQPTTDPVRNSLPQGALLDGAHGGNAHFFFLPPLLDEPNASGVFNPDLAPTVAICTTTSQDALGHCSSLLAAFHRGDGKGSDHLIEVSVTGQHYVLNWRTRDYAVPEDTPFRVVVLIGDVQLGYIDLIRQNNTYYDFTTNQIVSRNTSGGLPIKFRIEHGALCSSSATECFEGLVGPEGGTFTINRPDGTKPAGTEFPQGALQDTVTLIIERITSGECLPTDVPQFQGCYRFHTEPHVDQFELPVTVGVCLLDAAGVPFFNDQQLRLWKWSEVSGDPLEELERVQIQYLECPLLTQIGARSGSSLLLGAARAGAWLFKPLASLFAPRDAYAMGAYEGGKLINFSRIGWVRPLSVEIRAGDGQTGAAGQPLPVQPKVRVTNKYGMTVEGVADRVVEFTPSANGSAHPATTITDASGEAATTWTLSTTPGANTLLARTPTSRVIAPTPYQAEAQFTATGTQPFSGVLWMPPLGAPWDASSGIVSPTVTPTVVISANGEVIRTTGVSHTEEAYYTIWNVSDAVPDVIYRIAVQISGQPLAHIDLRRVEDRLVNAATNTVVLNLSLSTNLLIRFRLVQ